MDAPPAPAFEHVHPYEITYGWVDPSDYDISVEALDFAMHTIKSGPRTGQRTPTLKGRFQICGSIFSGHRFWHKFWLAPRWPGDVPKDVIRLKCIEKATGWKQLPGETIYAWADRVHEGTQSCTIWFRAPVTATPSPYDGKMHNEIDFLRAVPVPPPEPKKVWPKEKRPSRRRKAAGSTGLTDPKTVGKGNE
jgi:hypothetical protein